MPLRVVFAEDNYLVREGTTALLSTAPEVDIVATVSDSRDLLPTVAEMAPDAVLTDIRMPPTYTTEGIDAARRIRADHPKVGVLVLSQHADGAYAAELLSGGAAGLGYLLKERVADVAELVRALTEVARRYGATPAQVALAWVLRRPGTIAIPKAGDPEHVRENAGARDLELTAGDLALLDAAFPAPRRPQPLEML